MSIIGLDRAPPAAGQPPPDLAVVNAWTLAIMGTVLIAVFAFMAAQFSHLAIERLGFDAARIAIGQVAIGASVSAIFAGTGGAVLLAMAGRLRWAVSYAVWLAAATGTVLGTVLIEMGADMNTAIQQGGMVFIVATLLPALFYPMVLFVRGSAVRPMFLLIDIMGDMLNGIATSTPWGPRWGKALAVLVAILVVAGAAALLVTGR